MDAPNELTVSFFSVDYQHHTMSELPMEMPPSYNGHYPHNYTEYPENYNDLKDPGPYATTVILNNMPDRVNTHIHLSAY